MSLIHKALQKAEQDDATSKQDQNKAQLIMSGDESEEKKSDFMSFDLTPRTIILLALAILALGFMIYKNFIKSDSVAPPPKPIAKVSQSANNKKNVNIDAAKSLNTQGVSINKISDKKETLPPEVRLLKKEGESLFIAGATDEALSKFTQALTGAPDSSEILNSMGLIYKKKGEKEKALNYYNQSIEKDPTCVECLNNLGVLEVDMEDYVSAVFHFKKAIELKEDYADPYFNIGILMEKEGNSKSAINYYKKFLAFTDTDNQELKEKIKKRIEDLALDWHD